MRLNSASVDSAYISLLPLCICVMPRYPPLSMIATCWFAICRLSSWIFALRCATYGGLMIMGGGGVKLEHLRNKKAQINSVGKHTRVDNNKTKKAQASRFCSTVSHHSRGGGGHIITVVILFQTRPPDHLILQALGFGNGGVPPFLRDGPLQTSGLGVCYERSGGVL